MRLRGAILFVLVAGLGALVTVRAPAVLAWICPACYGLETVAPGLHVDPAMTLRERAALQSALVEARRRVAAFYGSLERAPTLLVCTTEACDAKLGGGAAAARAFADFFIHLSARGTDATTIAHELAHIELHARVGLFRTLTGRIPLWFDEGLAEVVAANPATLPGGNCRVAPGADLPSSHADWAARAFLPGSTLYAEAACAVARWLNTRGGRREALRYMEAADWDPARFIGRPD